MSSFPRFRFCAVINGDASDPVFGEGSGRVADGVLGEEDPVVIDNVLLWFMLVAVRSLTLSYVC